jgi:hypothetical protein
MRVGIVCEGTTDDVVLRQGVRMAKRMRLRGG